MTVGGVAEWPKVRHWKCRVRATVPWVRIPPPPPHPVHDLAVLDGEVAVPCNPQSAIAGLKSLSRAASASNEPCEMALRAGPHATGCVEPRQARKGATVRRPSRVPWEYLAGAGSMRSSRYGRFD